MKENEAKNDCDLKIIAYLNDQRLEIPCNPKKGCLWDLVWSGIGVRRAAANLLEKESTEGLEATVVGNCKKSTS